MPFEDRVPPHCRQTRPGAIAARWRAGLILAACTLVLLAAFSHARAATYKWVDDKGVTHYSDKLPSEAVNRGTTVLNKQAVPVSKVDPAPTGDQIKAKQAEAARREIEAREAEIQGRRDRALLQSYTSESEIDLARARSLNTIDSQLQSAQSFLAALTKRREALLAKKADAGDKGLPLAEERELDGTSTEIAKQQALIALKQRERGSAIARYDADKARWRELRAIADANRDAATGTGPRASAAGTPAPAGVAAKGATTTPR